MTHQELCERAYRWLVNTRHCQFALMSPVLMAGGEQPDAIGWHNGVSHMVECKVSRSDYYADRRKLFRLSSALGMGAYRWLMVPADFPSLDASLVGGVHLPGWGLLSVHPKTVRVLVGAEQQPSYCWIREALILSHRARRRYDDHPQGCEFDALDAAAQEIANA